MNFLLDMIRESWHLLLDSSIYILFGLLVSGFLRVFLNPSAVGRHLGQGRFKSVFKSAFLGIPIPLCSCGVLPAAVSLKKQGANNGAVTAFMISTPESGVDSLAITYALLDPIMTVARPVAAFVAAASAGISENLFSSDEIKNRTAPDISCPIDGCCDGVNCPPEEHARHHTFAQKSAAGVRFALTDVWGDIAAWFFVGVLLAGLITALIPDDVVANYLGGGISSMLLMLAVGIPLYICATASTPIAAALILKGVSPGAALVFLLAGPATNITSLTVLFGVLGKRATAIYLAAIAIVAVLAGLAVDWLYGWLGIEPLAAVGKAAELIPEWLGLLGAIVLMIFSIKPVWRSIKSRFSKKHHHGHDDDQPYIRLTPLSNGQDNQGKGGCSPGCGCGS